MAKLKQVGIIGTGLLGASVGLGLKGAGLAERVVGVARRAETHEAARRVGAIDVGSAEVGDAVKGSELVIVAVPLGQFDAVFAEIARHDHADLVVTDVGSTKADVLEAARRQLPEPGRFVGAHPMAGSEKQGPEAARGDLCEGKPCVITPAEETLAWALERVEQLWAGLGMSLIRMGAREHDEKTATVSHLPHLMAVMLVHVVGERGGLEVASSGYRDTSRLASSNPPMRADILEANMRAVRAALGSLRGKLEEVDRLLEAGDRAGLLALLEEAQRQRDEWVAERAEQ